MGTAVLVCQGEQRSSGEQFAGSELSLLWVIDPQVGKEKPRFLKYSSSYRPVSFVRLCWQSDSKHVIKR